MIYSVYCITNSITNKRYIGITSQTLEQRFQQHLKDANNDSERYLCRAIRKYGVENFTIELIDDTAKSPQELYQLEQKYIIQYNTYAPNGMGYNMTHGGEGTLGRPCSEETRDKIRKLKMGVSLWNGKRVHPFTGKTQSEESNEKRREKLIGRKVSRETIEKRITTWKRNYKKENHPHFGKHHISEEVRKRMGEQSHMHKPEWKEWARNRFLGKDNPMYGKKHTEETLEKLRYASSGGNNPKSIRTAVINSDGVILSVHAYRKEIVGFEGITIKQLENRMKSGKDYKGYLFKKITQEQYEFYKNELEKGEVIEYEY